MFNFNKLKYHDWILTTIIFLLVIIGAVVVYSTTFGAETAAEGAGLINRQLIFIILGFIVYFLISLIDTNWFRYLPIQILLYITIISLLIIVWVFGEPVRNTHRWIEWGAIRIQPSEYAKITLIIINSAILASILKASKSIEIKWSQAHKSNKSFSKILFIFNRDSPYFQLISRYSIAIILSIIPVLLILIEPALGNALITIMICVSLYFIAAPNQLKIAFLIIIALLSINIVTSFFNFNFIYEKVGLYFSIGSIDFGILIISLILILLITFLGKLDLRVVVICIIAGLITTIGIRYYWNNIIDTYQKSRIEVFLDPEKDPTGAGWQVRQSQIAVGSGQLWGKGFLQGSQTKLRYLPDAFTDFIFAALSEEFGFIGSGFVIILYGFLIIKIFKIGERADSVFESLICGGVASMILLHVFINIGMNLGALPVTGIPLPLISYGGSSVMVTMIALGFVQGITMKEPAVDTTNSLVVTSMAT